jgi:F420-dependent oxidoreductase-like protein
MKFGISVGPQNTTWAALKQLAVKGDRLGFDSYWVFDHLLPLTGNIEDPIFEAWALMAGLADATSSITLGTMVTCNTLRAPALLAKMAATVDHVSDGRVIVGIGAGYFVAEHEAFGIPLPPRPVRAAMLDEAVQVLKGLWAGGRFSFAGDYYTIRDAPFAPAPVQPGGPPIMVGGAGEKFTLRTVAKHADHWNLPPGSKGITPEVLRAKLAVLAERCAEVGRDPSTIEINVSQVIVVDNDHKRAIERRRQLAAERGMSEELAAAHITAGDPASIIDRVHEWQDAGTQHFGVGVIPGFNSDADIDLFAEKVVAEMRG